MGFEITDEDEASETIEAVSPGSCGGGCSCYPDPYSA